MFLASTGCCLSGDLGTFVHLRCYVSFFLLFCRSVLVFILLNAINKSIYPVNHCGYLVEITECLLTMLIMKYKSCQQWNKYTIGQQRFRGVLDCNNQSKTASINLSVLTYCTT